MRDAGCTLEEAVVWLSAERITNQIFFTVGNLDYLIKGGRIGKVTAMAGTMLQIKPLITFAADGQLQSIAKVRGRNLVIRKLIELVTQSHNGVARYNLAVATAALRRRWRFCRASSPPPCQTTTTSGAASWMVR